MRILLVTSSYSPVIGGLQTVTGMLARSLQAQGHSVVIATNRYPRVLPKREVIDGVLVRRIQFLYPRLHHITSRRFDLFIAGILFLPLTLCQLVLLMSRFKMDVVNLHYVGSPSLFLWLIHSFWRFPWLVSLHGGDVFGEPMGNRFDRWLFTSVVLSADRVSACSNYLLQQAIALAPAIATKSVVIQNGVNIELFSNAEPFRRDRPYLFAVGQLEQHKGFDLLIKAFVKITKKYPDTDLLIAGNGSQMPALEKLIENEGLRTRIQFLGPLGHDRIASLMRGSAAVVIPSRVESFGIVALEARAARRPIVATKVGGLIEALEGISVQWAQEATVEVLQQSIERALDRCESPSAPATTLEDEYLRAHSWTNIAQAYTDSYTRITGENRNT